MSDARARAAVEANMAEAMLQLVLDGPYVCSTSAVAALAKYAAAAVARAVAAHKADAIEGGNHLARKQALIDGLRGDLDAYRLQSTKQAEEIAQLKDAFAALRAHAAAPTP